jgi:hypothetical protein
MERTVPRMEEAYAHLMPLFFGALGRLARQGFVVSPADSMDLIHDFFVDAWPALNDHFDPQKGVFESYASAAFVRFARPRIIRLQRWKHSLVGTDHLDEHGSGSWSGPASLDDDKVRGVISNIPIQEREILTRYLYRDCASERSLAQEFLLTRYRLSEILIDALGHVTVSLDRPAAIPQLDWKVACSLWRDRRTVQETSSLLALTPEQIRRANARNVLFLKQVLKRYQEGKSFHQRKEQMRTRVAVDGMELLKQALQSPQQENLLARVRAEAKHILSQMASPNLQAPDLDMEELRPEWVAKVYQALFEGATTGTEEYEIPVVEELFSVHRDKTTAIGEAFRDMLAALPNFLSSPELFSHLPHISADEQRLLRQAPDVKASLSVSGPFLLYGMRPLKVLYAAEGVSDLAERLLELKFLKEDQLILGERITFTDDQNVDQSLEDLMILEITQTAEITQHTAKALYSWLTRAAQYTPYLFKGFRAQVRPHAPDSVALLRDLTPVAVASVAQRWATQLGTRGHVATSV